MFSPGGFDATLDKRSTQSARIKLLDHLPKTYTCIVSIAARPGSRAAASSA
jgi:hypothetical protein